LWLKLWATDKDETSRWKEVLKVTGAAAAKMAQPATMAAQAAASGGTAVAIGSGVAIAGAAAGAVSDLIPLGRDEPLGFEDMILSSDGRWGTYGVSFPVDLDNGDRKRGPFRLFLTVSELPLSWKVKIIE
jgi:hypothetical protein